MLAGVGHIFVVKKYLLSLYSWQVAIYLQGKVSVTARYWKPGYSTLGMNIYTVDSVLKHIQTNIKEVEICHETFSAVKFHYSPDNWDEVFNGTATQPEVLGDISANKKAVTRCS